MRPSVVVFRALSFIHCQSHRSCAPGSLKEGVVTHKLKKREREREREREEREREREILVI